MKIIHFISFHFANQTETMMQNKFNLEFRCTDNEVFSKNIYLFIHIKIIFTNTYQKYDFKFHINFYGFYRVLSFQFKFCDLLVTNK